MPTIKECARTHVSNGPTDEGVLALIKSRVKETCQTLHGAGNDTTRIKAHEEFLSLLADNTDSDGVPNYERTYASITAKAMDDRNDLVSYPNLRECIIAKISNIDRR